MSETKKTDAEGQRSGRKNDTDRQVDRACGRNLGSYTHADAASSSSSSSSSSRGRLGSFDCKKRRRERRKEVFPLSSVGPLFQFQKPLGSSPSQSNRH